MNLKKLQNGSDIRGVGSEGIEGQPVNLTHRAVYSLACAFVEWLRKKTGKKDLRIGVGRDSRISGPRIQETVCEAMTDLGVHVYETGLSSTPAMFMTTVTEGFLYDGAVMITASHLPFNRNGLKFFTRDGGLEKEDIAALIGLAEKDDFKKGKKGTAEPVDFMSVYAGLLADKIRRATGEERPLLGMKIVVDAGNGAGGFFVEKVLKPLGADTTGSQFLEPDGLFPNHIPNPEDKTAMAAIIDAVKKNGADFGVIFDTDVDRAGAVDSQGHVLNRNRLIAMISAILLEETPGTTIVTDSVTSSGLAKFIKAKGGVHHRFKRGYKNVINESIRLNAAGQDSQLAIETSGHGALKENYFLDDGAYLITKLLIKMAQMRKEGKTLFSLIADLEEPAEAQEFRLRIQNEGFRQYGEKVIAELTEYVKGDARFQVAPDNHEGIRVSLGREDGDGWFLVRLSLHDPIIPVNVESDSAGGVKKITKILYDFLRRYDQLDLHLMREYIEA